MKPTSTATSTAAPRPTPAKPPEPASTGSYAMAYGQLTAIADKLRGATSPSIDTLVDDLRAARQAYGTCRDRLAAVRAEIEAEIAETTAEQA